MTSVDVNDLELILSGAKVIQNGESYKVGIEKLKSSGTNELPIEAVYELGETFEIKKEYIEQFMELRFPSNERQLKNLTECKGQPSIDLIGEIYAKTFLKNLRSCFPNEKFYASSLEFYDINYRDFIIDKEEEKITIVKRRLLKDKQEKSTFNTKFAHISLERNLILLFNPCFIEACKDSLSRLNKQFTKEIGKIRIEYTYNPYLEE